MGEYQFSKIENTELIIVYASFLGSKKNLFYIYRYDCSIEEKG